MFVNFASDFMNNLPKFTIKVWVGNAMTEAYDMQVPIQMAFQQFMNIVNHLSQQSQPMKVVCSNAIYIPQSNYNESCIEKEVKFVFYNPSYEREIGINE